MGHSLSNKDLQATGITMIILTTIVFGLRLYLGVFKQRKFGWEEGWLTASWLVFMVVSTLYLELGETIFRLLALAAGEIEMYPTVADDGLKMQKTFFVTTSGLWICLWLVKASLLSLYKRLMNSVKTFIILWWIVVVLCVVLLAGAITSSMLSCSSMKAWFTSGACNTPRDIRAAFISLWYSYAVDIFTDLLVMLLPLGLIRNLQMHWRRKVSLGGLFCLGFICIAVSTVRVTYLGSDASSGEFKQPSTAWLALWGIVESAIAVIIGCGPGLYRESKIISSSRRQAYYENQGYQGSGYVRAVNDRFKSSKSRQTAETELEPYPRTTVKANNSGSSQEELFRTGDKIMVTQEFQVVHGDTAPGQAR